MTSRLGAKVAAVLIALTLAATGCRDADKGKDKSAGTTDEDAKDKEQDTKASESSDKNPVIRASDACEIKVEPSGFRVFTDVGSPSNFDEHFWIDRRVVRPTGAAFAVDGALLLLMQEKVGTPSDFDSVVARVGCDGALTMGTRGDGNFSGPQLLPAGAAGFILSHAGVLKAIDHAGKIRTEYGFKGSSGFAGAAGSGSTAAFADGSALGFGYHYQEGKQTPEFGLYRIGGDGQVDMAFGPDGFKVLERPPGVENLEFGASSVDKTTGAAMIAGTATFSGSPKKYQVVIARLKPSGEYDADYCGAGLCLIGEATTQASCATVGDLIALANGKAILQVGVGRCPRASGGFEASLRRIGADGAIEVGYDPPFAFTTAIAVGADDSVYVAGENSTIEYQNDCNLIRLRNDLSLDESFGTMGRAHFTVIDGVHEDLVTTILPLADGGVLVSGTVDIYQGASDVKKPTHDYQPFIARLTATGNLASSP